MGLGVIYDTEVRARLMAGIVLLVRSARCQGGNSMFIAGALALAEYRITAEGLDWAATLNEARAQLGEDNQKLLDTAQRLRLGAPSE